MALAATLVDATVHVPVTPLAERAGARIWYESPGKAWATGDFNVNHPWFSVRSRCWTSKELEVQPPAESGTLNSVVVSDAGTLIETGHAKYVLSVDQSSGAPPP